MGMISNIINLPAVALMSLCIGFNGIQAQEVGQRPEAKTTSKRPPVRDMKNADDEADIALPANATEGKSDAKLPRKANASTPTSQVSASGAGKTNLSVKMPTDADLGEMDKQWSTVITPLLQKQVWRSYAGYDAAHELLVPLHASFGLNREKWITEFSDHFNRMLEDKSALVEGELPRLQYLFFVSEYVNLMDRSKRSEKVPIGLRKLLMEEIDTCWTKKPAWLWGRPPFQGGMKERIQWKLSAASPAKKYYRAIVDVELYLFVIASNLETSLPFFESRDRSVYTSVLRDISALSRRVFDHEGRFSASSEWQFQPGVWSDHPDYLYAGNPQPVPGIQARPVSTIGWDTAHFMRFPPCIAALYRNATTDEDKVFYGKILNGMEAQFFNKVLVPPSANVKCYLLKNYFDGSNGVFRWGYSSLGPDSGYGPNMMSSSLLLGWWSFFGTDRSRDLYRQLAGNYPFSEGCRKHYLGPQKGGKEPDPEMIDPGKGGWPLKGLILKLASFL